MSCFFQLITVILLTTELIIAIILAFGSMTFAMLHVTNSDKKDGQNKYI